MFARVFFTWIGPLLRLGAERPLQQHDINNTRHSLPHWGFISCEPAAAAFMRQRQARARDTRGAALAVPMYRAMRSTFWFGALLIGTQQVVLFFMPITLTHMLAFLDQPAAPNAQGWWLTLALFTLACLKTLLENHYFITMQRCGIRALATANDLIFRKAMRLSPHARGLYKTGKVLNLM